jgi:hypothetical protein
MWSLPARIALEIVAAASDRDGDAKAGIAIARVAKEK